MQHPDVIADGFGRITLVYMEPARQHQNFPAAKLSKNKQACVRFDGAPRKPWNLRIGDCDFRPRLFCQPSEPGAEHHGNFGRIGQYFAQIVGALLILLVRYHVESGVLSSSICAKAASAVRLRVKAPAPTAIIQALSRTSCSMRRRRGLGRRIPCSAECTCIRQSAFSTR